MIEHQFTLHSADAFEAAVSPLLGGHRMRSRGAPSAPFSLSHSSFGQVSVSRIRYGRETEIEVDGVRPHWALSTVRSGRVRIGLPGQRVDASVGGWTAYEPDRCDPLHYDDRAELLTITVPEAAIQRALAAWVGPSARPRLALQHGALPAGPAGPLLDEIARRLWHCAAQAGEVPAGYLKLQEELALCELAMAFAEPARRTSPHSRSAASQATLERALQFIEAHVDDALSLVAVAEAAGVGVRALTLAFQRELGVSPMRHHRHLRLDRARLDLLARRGTVTEVAVRWGFWNPGDFARHYRERHGELPTATRAR